MHKFQIGERVMLNSDHPEYAIFNGELGTVVPQNGMAWGDVRVLFDRDFRNLATNQGRWINPHTEGWWLDNTWLLPARTPSTLRETW